MMPMPFSEPVTCPDCGKQFGKLSPYGMCWGCADKKAEREARESAAAAILADIPGEATKRLAAAGMAKDELAADRKATTPAVGRAMPRDVVEAMLEGRVPSRGFGLWGTTGVGKSLGLAALVRCYAEASLRARAPREGDVPMDLGIEWCSWIPEVEWLRINGTDAIAVGRRTRRLATVPLLIIDDLARETRRRAYSEDFVAGKLDLIISERSREKLPTLWTANVGPVDLVGIYDGATVSRLEGENPGIQVSGPDRRLST